MPVHGDLKEYKHILEKIHKIHEFKDTQVLIMDKNKKILNQF